jgi:FAD/FMN-containing dehydrogenase
MPSEAAQSAAIAALQARLPGQVRSDRLTRALYATDASIYEITPDAVCLPKSAEDVAAIVEVCSEHRTPITPRGAGTGLTGGAVNTGVQIDLSRHMCQIRDLDTEARTVRVGPGVVLDELNAYLAPHRLYFAPDVATSSRATIGGMIGNNSCGAHSVYIGRTVNHIRQIQVVLSDASIVNWGDGSASNGGAFAQRCVETIARVGNELADEIKRRWPTVMRRNGGYALDRLQLDDGRANADTIIVGSEGTLGIVTEATLNLLPIPAHKGLVVAHFNDMLSSLAATPVILKHNPAAVELVDKLILDATLMNPSMLRRRWFLDGDPAAILIIELYDEDAGDLQRRLNDLAADLKRQHLGYAWPIISDPAKQGDPWEVRKSGLGLLMSIPGDNQPYAFVEDTAVEPDRLHDYIKRFGEIMSEEGVDQAGYYAHASVGCLHVRPVLNLKRGRDVSRMRRIADRISSLAQDFGGTMTGEHGDGLVRSEWLAKIYGPRITAGFRAIKAAFDPQNLLNPGKIVDPLPMDENLRLGDSFRTQEPLTILNYEKHGGIAGLAGMCTGVGQCRR